MDKHFNAIDKRLGHQDWTSVVVKTKQTIKEENKTSSKNLSVSHQKDIKLLKQVENDELTHKKVSPDQRKQIQQKRCQLKWKQKDLAQKTNLPVSVINDIETGKAIYNPQHINKIKRVLKL